MSKTTTFEAWAVIRRKKIGQLRFFWGRNEAEYYAEEWRAPNHPTHVQRVRVTVEILEDPAP